MKNPSKDRPDGSEMAEEQRHIEQGHSRCLLLGWRQGYRIEPRLEAERPTRFPPYLSQIRSKEVGTKSRARLELHVAGPTIE